ncbi:aromatic ring-hydroxylating oxygenase subunit alpha [Cylindrospermopsis curvispora]|uniref:Aromatic ring-hydroxylating dioxygenase subunit alpha n=1 Tax=Cylindrospermopsis curvispora GIHE-G1 TaxID=2666332 RepID=A0A7H0EWM3_9CYAN|nr:aromatic ring-hydroxylating dioxygenase subunit alpha [Cylindrospermopsis curvispora]QNP28189.1 aromatic ring-hydroxylating dioxygenase subunit alpha [Cylindrospermopsis curvispora GIHE-G1]BAZ89017.1 Rieske (2Fe-2S) iron-sulfur domain-containing protein [Raphidiopsis curvata NIES-932]
MVDNKNILLRNLWYYALPSSQLKTGKMISRVLLREPILFTRDKNGQVFAIEDICPHRAVPLSCGRFDGEQVECCYHGWRFDSQGKCTEIPSLLPEQSIDLSKFNVKSYPVYETQGNIWIYIYDKEGSPVNAQISDIPQVPGFSNGQPDLVEVMKFPCFIDHAVTGLMDPAHSPYVHQVWWWRSGKLHEEVKQFDPSEYGFTVRRHKLSDNTENMSRLYWLVGGGIPEVEISFRLPGVRIEEITFGKHRVCNLTAVTPISDTETEVNFVLYGIPAWLKIFTPLIQILTRKFLDQDRNVVEKQQIGLQYNPILRLIKDSDMQAQWYFQLKREFSRAAAENREFVNPVKSVLLRWRA